MFHPFSDDDCYRALLTHDRRFDGVFFVGVTSTGVYCRPVCRVRSPRRDRCLFYSTAAAAESNGFRPCLRCKPEMAPGMVPIDASEQLAHAAAMRIQNGALEDGESLEILAEDFGVTSRHLRRTVTRVLGASPVQLAQTHRLLTAKRLLSETKLSITEVAFASGFRSLRRFNTLFRERYGLTPTSIRGKTFSPIHLDETIQLTLGYRPPFAWAQLLSYFAGRAVPGVEWISTHAYARTLRVGKHVGWLRVTQNLVHETLAVTVSHSLAPVLGAVLTRVRNAFDLDTRPDLILAQLKNDPLLESSLKKNPGMRVPGAFDGFEIAVRTIVGQQVSVAAATTVMSRLGSAFGEAIQTPFNDLHRLPVQPSKLARLAVGDLARLGLNSQRAKAIIALAKAVIAREVSLEPGGHPTLAMAKLQKLPGIGPWTANYLAMRVLRWPDAFLAGDLGVRKALGNITERAATTRSELWQPWRAYAVMHLWNTSTPL